jgi:hypothetical protein
LAYEDIGACPRHEVIAVDAGKRYLDRMAWFERRHIAVIPRETLLL